MWIFSRYGFFSAVCGRQPDGLRLEKDRILVRARDRRHLQALKERFQDLLDGCDIRQSAGTDYAFRIVVDKHHWARVVTALAAEIDYGNFKAEVASHQGDEGSDYEDALHEVWAVMRRLQRV